MYPEITPGFALVKQHWTGLDGTGHAYCIWGDANGAGLDAVHIATAVNTAMNLASGMTSLMSNEATYADTSVVLNTGGVFTEATVTAGYPGVSSGTPVPPNTSVLVKKLSALHGRHYRGRMYLPYFPTADCDMAQGQIAGSQLAGCQGILNVFYDTLVANGVAMVLFHRDLTVIPTPVTSLQVEQPLATQRRRLRKAPHH